jgi:hypothetical protein
MLVTLLTIVSKKFNSNGTFIAKLGSPCISDDQMDNPTGEAVDAAGNVYVCDYGNSRILIFRPQ